MNEEASVFMFKNIIPHKLNSISRKLSELINLDNFLLIN